MTVAATDTTAALVAEPVDDNALITLPLDTSIDTVSSVAAALKRTPSAVAPPCASTCNVEFEAPRLIRAPSVIVPATPATQPSPPETAATRLFQTRD